MSGLYLNVLGSVLGGFIAVVLLEILNFVRKSYFSCLVVWDMVSTYQNVKDSKKAESLHTGESFGFSDLRIYQINELIHHLGIWLSMAKTSPLHRNVSSLVYEIECLMSFMKIPNIDCEEDRFRNLHSSEISGIIDRVLHELEAVSNSNNYYTKLRKWTKPFTKKEKREKAKEVLKRSSGEVTIVFPNNKFAERLSAGIRSKGLFFSSGVILPRTHTFGEQKQDTGRFWGQKQKTNRFWEQTQDTGKS